MKPIRTAALLCLSLSCGKHDAAAPRATTPATTGAAKAELWEDPKPEEAPADGHAPEAAEPPAAPPPPPAKSRQPVGRKDGGRPEAPVSTEDYAHHDVNRMTLVADDRLSTFAVDVDTASYAIVRRKILEGQAVPADAVRVEEFLNYFRYAYEGPGDERPFAVHTEAAPSPFTPGRHVLRVAVKGRDVAPAQRKRANLVFLVDVSGSMSSPDKLPLAQRSLRILVDNLNPGDTVALVTYAGATRVLLPPTGIEDKAKIHAAIDELSAGGSTAMGSGIELAYRLAARRLSDDTVSRVIVLSDGDANVGRTTHEEILATIRGHVREGVTLSTVGFGMGNYKDRLMEQLANKGNGNAYYIDGISQAKRVFQEQLGGTLEVIAQDVKVQVEMHPAAISAYRLVGYENRDLADRDFRDDRVDAGEIGAGHSVTALYEVELAPGSHGPLATVRLRAKKPRGAEAAEHAVEVGRDRLRASFAEASPDLRFATAVMGFAEILRRSPYADGWKLEDVRAVARAATPPGNAEREELLELVGRAMRVPAIATR
jgi:Ca-activated chloride channel family protein